MPNDDKLTPSTDTPMPVVGKPLSKKDIPMIPMSDWDIDDNPPMVPAYPDVPKALNENPNLVADPRNYPKKNRSSVNPALPGGRICHIFCRRKYIPCIEKDGSARLS